MNDRAKNRDLRVSSKNLLDGIRNDMVFLRATLQLFEELFLGNDEKDKLLRSAAGCFILIEQAFVDCLMLGVSRLVDTPKTGSYENLSLHRLVGELKSEGRNDLAAQIDQAIEQKTEEIERIRSHRMKRLAHRDLQTALGKPDAANQLLPDVTFNDIRCCVRCFHDALDACQTRMENATFGWKVHISGDASSLFSRLRRARRLDELTREFGEAHFRKRPPVNVRFDSKTAKLIWD